MSKCCVNRLLSDCVSGAGAFSCNASSRGLPVSVLQSSHLPVQTCLTDHKRSVPGGGGGLCFAFDQPGTYATQVLEYAELACA